MIDQFIRNGIIAGSVYTLVAVGFAMIYRTVRSGPVFPFCPWGGVHRRGVFYLFLLQKQRSEFKISPIKHFP
jgi:branched-subunit amino acid ABC-type transport system permease component